MIIRLNVNWKNTGLITLAILCLMLSAGFLLRGSSDETRTVNQVENVEQADEMEKNINEILAEKGQGNFFSEYRMERERIRSKQMETLKEIINSEQTTQEAKDAAALRIVAITADIEKEVKTEGLIKSKGYEDCVMIIQPECTTAVILSSNLRIDQEEEIKKMVSLTVPCSEDSICIIIKEQ